MRLRLFSLKLLSSSQVERPSSRMVAPSSSLLVGMIAAAMFMAVVLLAVSDIVNGDYPSLDAGRRSVLY